MIIVDTNVVSAVMFAPPDERVRHWFDGIEVSRLWFSTIGVMEIRFGILSLPEGRRRDGLAATFGILKRDIFSNRILSFDDAAAEAAAMLQARRKISGRPVDAMDTMVAGIAISRGSAIATRNTRHFDDAGIRLINPFTQALT